MSKKDLDTHLEPDNWWLIARARIRKAERAAPVRTRAEPRGAARLWRSGQPTDPGLGSPQGVRRR
ncbi:hypothetical protein ThidrDRAFT_1799 [Thiorhodococcus drewsii AZ1]|uniref:Uncharacterized protein n=1 Tax=Thiorhodococcus drewsii AZ1 TaxID=765913 RepID=G2E0I6_9GAMM|nr:hypothetical protein [Thiorhodococcus drewsii]EGV31914.1 hypothetical protein ThidrDRAFT_1799 [Thiorhodococcus drewsii AZ1]